MPITTSYLDVRPAKRTPIVELAGGGQRAGAHRVPVLPRGWAPLTAEQQQAVLDACDATPDALVFKLGSLWDPDADYRVYRLQNETWTGLWLACRCSTDGDGAASNRELLGLGTDPSRAVRVALDVFNRDLEARGELWRLGVEPPPVPAAGDAPRRP